MTTLVLGVDIGTSSVKVGVAVDGAASVPTSRVAVPWTTTATGAEIDPDALFDVVLDAVRQACAAWPDASVAAIGVASFAESTVLLGPDGEPVCPLVAWHDSRGAAEADALAEAIGATTFSARAGLPVSPLCSAVKARAAAAAGVSLTAVTAVLSVTDWVVYRLSGVRGFDLSLAARTGWLDLAARGWSDDVVAWTGLPTAAMPELVDSGVARGRVRADVAGAPESLVGAVVVAAGMDHLVAAVGASAAAPGDVWDSCGTAEAFVRSTSPLDSASVLAAVELGLTVGWHADPRHQVILGAQRSGYVFQRVLGLLGVATAEDLRRFEARARPEGDSSASLAFERLYDATYTISGLSSRTRPQDVWSALVSQVAADGAALLRQADAVAGPHARVVMGGGWAASAWFQDAKRTHDPDIAATSIEQPGAEGAAVLASRALGA